MKGLKETNPNNIKFLCFLVEIVKFDEFEKLSCIVVVSIFWVKLML
jgi:hypothetical protein